MKHLSREALLCGGVVFFFVGGGVVVVVFWDCLFVLIKISRLARRTVSESILVVSSATILHAGLLFRSKTCCSRQKWFARLVENIGSIFEFEQINDSFIRRA